MGARSLFPFRWFLMLLMSAAPLLTSPAVQAKDRLFWLLRDLPPFTIFEGGQQGQGVIDTLLPQLIEGMPGYDYSLARVNRARAIQMLREPSFTCDPSLLWTAERDRYIAFSEPFLGVMSSGLVVRKQSQAVVAPYLEQQEVDLKRLLGQTRLKLGIVAERSYSTQVDDILRSLPETAISRHYGNEAVASLLQMQRLGRLQLVLGYWHEIRYLIQQQGESPDDYAFYPIRGVGRYQFLHVGCSDTVQGRAAISQVNQILHGLRSDTLPGLYARWLDPHQRDAYLEDARHFFQAD
ncbi:TIGR02285 family protein [Pseudomonas sp.]|uniref:TIGR02285 family protein n=1 Tax=Pseudomonas sp. TaxID=306 RepID=UPI0039C8C7F7